MQQELKMAVLAADETGGQSSFVAFLRFSFYRPRDIVTMMGFLQEQFKAHGKARHAVFGQADFEDPEFRRRYADYLMGEIKGPPCVLLQRNTL